MASVADPDMHIMFTKTIEEIHSKHLQAYEEIVDATTDLCQSHEEILRAAVASCAQKCKDNEMLFETVHTYKRDLEHKNMSLKEKRQAKSEIQPDTRRDDMIQKIEKLRNEQDVMRDVIVSQNKANKKRIKVLQQAREIFQDALGLEIRKIQGELVQFIFKHINPVDDDSVYIITIGIKEDGLYQIVSSDPPLECVPALERRLKETNNLPAFLANVRKGFITQAKTVK
ncbi:kinetochore protein Spc25 [Genypterus blacodes]|uniref:kinetochore protein Spc25 n=1 Tax=Genypterus blacodes TaxID=154954 RepID=UPI003F770EDB